MRDRAVVHKLDLVLCKFNNCSSVRVVADLCSTLRNQQESHLLRLPAELRERIWTLAFGNRTLHPVTSRSYLSKGVGQITYHDCMEPFSDKEIYEFTLQGAADDDPFVWKAPEVYDRKIPGWTSFNGVHMCTHEWIERRYELRPQTRPSMPMVCKQMYYEATPLMWKTTTLCFTACSDFQDFVKASPKLAARVEQLTLIPQDERHGWDAALTPLAVGALTSLKGLHLVVQESVSHGLKSKFDTMKPAMTRHVPNLVTQFQALPLDKERTTVWFTGRADPHDTRNMHPMLVANWQPKFTVAERLEFAEFVREKLLEYRQRRRTARGRG
jgi:hypothetical protein